MNEKLAEFFNSFRYLRSMQEIVNEIVTLDYYVTNFDEQEAIAYLDFCITKYASKIKRIGSLYKNMIVIENDAEIYDTKSSEEINSDCEYVRDCLIIIGTVESGIRPNLQTVIEEIN